MLYFDSKCEEGWTIEDVEKIRESSLRLVNQEMHPRYALVAQDLFKASNALMNEMKMDQSKSSQTVPQDGQGIYEHAGRFNN